MPSRRLPLTLGSAGLNPLAESKPPAPLGPYRHTTTTPHAAVRISMRYRLCAGGYLWVLCCGPRGGTMSARGGPSGTGCRPPLAWNAGETAGSVVLCVCGVLLGREGEGGITAGGTASLPGGGGIAAGTRGTTA